MIELARYGIDARRWPRALGFAAAHALMTPLSAVGRARYRRELESVRVAAPVFILGHWRSGTTYLHNLLSLDPQFGWVSMLEVIAPEAVLSFGPFLRRALAPLLPATRPFDSVPLDFDSPQEEELALVSLGAPNFYFGYFYFPRADEQFFRECLLFDEGPPSQREGFVRGLLTVLRRAALRQGGRTLCLKNPAHTGRLRLLLELFPDARFVHIVRDPRAVFPSTNHMRRTMIDQHALQRVDESHVRERTVSFYERIMRRYLRDRAAVPAGRLVELRLEDLEARPLDELRRVYDGLGLPGFAAMEKRFRDAAEAGRSYRRNAFPADAETNARLQKDWSFAFETWGYA